MSNDDHLSTERDGPVQSSAGTDSTTRSGETAVCSFESFESNPDEGIHRAMFDASEIAPSTAVVGAVSVVADSDPLEMEPLHSAIDVDALNALVGGTRRSGGDRHAKFPVDEFRVTVSGAGCVTVRTPQNGTAPEPGNDAH